MNKVGKWFFYMNSQTTTEDRNLNRLSRIEGQVRGIQKMIRDNRDSADIITQIQAVRAALLSVSKRILEDDLRECIGTLLPSENNESSDMQLQEIMLLITKLGK